MSDKPEETPAPEPIPEMTPTTITTPTSEKGLQVPGFEVFAVIASIAADIVLRKR